MITSNGDTAKARPPRILIADDQSDVLEALRLMLKGRGFEIEVARSIGEIVTAVETRALDAVLMDLNYSRDTTSGTEGLDILPRLQAADHTMAVIVMTAWGSVDSAVEAMRRGAWDYIEKPWDNARLLATLCAQREVGRASRRAQRLEGEDALLKGKMTTAMLAWQPRLHDPLLGKWLHRIDVPTLILWGAGDKVLPPAYGAAWQKAIPNATLSTVAGAGHIPHVEKPAETAAAIANFRKEAT